MSHKYKLLTIAASILALHPCVLAQSELKPADKVARDGINKVNLSGLTNPDYLVREAAMKEVWAHGKKAIPALKAALDSKHPELVARASVLLRNIRIGIRPDTSNEVTELIQEFFEANLNRKKQILRELYSERAYNNMLYLLNELPDTKLRESLYNDFNYLGHRAARTEIGRGNIEGAIELLEMSPKNEKVLRSLAFLYARTGKLDEKLAELPSVPKKLSEKRWKKMLLEESGNRKLLREYAKKTDDTATLALLDLEEGKPERMIAYLGSQLPFEAKQGTMLINSVYTGEMTPNTEASLTKFKKWAERGNYGWDEDNLLALQILFYKDPIFSEKLYLKNLSNIGKFEQYSSLDRYTDAFKAMGVPTSDEGFIKWVHQTTDLAMKEVHRELEDQKEEEGEKLLPERDNQEEYELSHVDVLKSVASLYKQVGNIQRAEGTILPYLKRLKQIDKETWQHTLSELTSRSMRMHETALKLAIEDAKSGEDFYSYVGLFYNDQEYLEEIWEALLGRKNISPKQSFDDLASLMYMRLGDEAKREKLIDQLLQNSKKNGIDSYSKMLMSLRQMCQVTHDYLALQKVFKLELENEKNKDLKNVLQRKYSYVCYLTKDWNSFLKYEKFNQDELLNSSDWYTKRSIAYRSLGKIEEADQYLDHAILLTLGIEDNLYTISRELAESGNLKKANEILRQIVLVLGKNINDRYARAAFSLLGSQGYYLENHIWDKAAAYCNVSACLFGVDEVDFSDFSSALVKQTAHLQRFTRGMQLLEQGDKKRAKKMLDEAHAVLLGNGYLADHFYPAVRKTFLKKEHKQWVDQSYNYVMKSLKIFPNDTNSKNTLAWILSRSHQKLDEGIKLSEFAVKHAPGEAAYIDTMGELYHAKGDKKKAIEWGNKSVKASLSGSQLGMRTEDASRRRAWSLYLQRERFKQGLR